MNVSTEGMSSTSRLDIFTRVSEVLESVEVDEVEEEGEGEGEGIEEAGGDALALLLAKDWIREASAVGPKAPMEQ